MEFWTCPICKGLVKEYSTGALEVEMVKHVRRFHDGDETIMCEFLTYNDIHFLKINHITWTVPIDYPPCAP